MRGDADTAQVEPIRIPARLDRDIGVWRFVRVTLAGATQEPMKVVVQFERAPVKLAGAFRCAQTVLGIGSLVDASTSAPVSAASRTPFSSTRAQCATP
jgi:hypothetical protein